MNLIAITHLAEHIESGYSRLSSDADWEKRGAAIMAHLMIGEDQFEELAKDAQEILEESGS